MDFLTPEAIQAFLTVVMIDLVLAGDNAVVIGLAAAGLPQDQRNKAILMGVLAATVLRIAFALVATQLLAIVGLLFAGGVLLLWVCWKMWRELRSGGHQTETEALRGQDLNADGLIAGAKVKTLRQAITQIVIADVSMSLDNVLAVAGAAHEHPMILVFGLGLSVLLMGVAATFIARLLNKHRWIAYVGLLIIFYVALRMMWHGSLEVCGEALPMIGASVPDICLAPPAH
ncbi:MAG: TerC family protein [Alphaproteobacteria bacterium]|nr:TerC family protein [Alphaproteobacteria bacterium]